MYLGAKQKMMGKSTNVIRTQKAFLPFESRSRDSPKMIFPKLTPKPNLTSSWTQKKAKKTIRVGAILEP